MSPEGKGPVGEKERPTLLDTEGPGGTGTSVSDGESLVETNSTLSVCSSVPCPTGSVSEYPNRTSDSDDRSSVVVRTRRLCRVPRFEGGHGA